MVVFLLALLFICAVAAAVVAAFAMPNLRAGSPVLTDRGERIAQRWARRLGPVTRVVRPVVRPFWRLARAVVRPLVRFLRPRVAPLTEAISRAVEDGVPAPAPRPAGSGSMGVGGPLSGTTRHV